MSGFLWKFYLEDDVDKFKLLLETSSYSVKPNTQRGTLAAFSGAAAGTTGSPGRPGSSPSLSFKSSNLSVPAAGHPPSLAGASAVLTKADLNGRDGRGLTLLHHAASSGTRNGLKFATALLNHPMTDVYAQDWENGWTALHRAFYFGNITIAHLILQRDIRNALSVAAGGLNSHAGALIKVKDKDGCAPFDLYADTLKDRGLWESVHSSRLSPTEDEDVDDADSADSSSSPDLARSRIASQTINLEGDELFTFGSNKNISLGFGDEDDRQRPERIFLQRPGHLLQRFHREYSDEMGARSPNRHGRNGEHRTPSDYPLARSPTTLPSVIRFKPIIIQDVQMSKLHTAVLTTDPESNLYMCGHGPGGRLGTGDHRTRFQFTCIEGGALSQKKIVSVALGHNHSLASSDSGEVFSWGSNAFGQLGYVLPQQNLHEEEPVQLLPRQLFGPLKREAIIGIAASRIHSVAHTTTSLYTFGKNEGQLGIVDSDARSLQIQTIPRKVAASLFSSGIDSVAAIERATVCLLENREVWVFANYGYTRLAFPLDGFSNYFLNQSFLTTRYFRTPNEIRKVTAGGDTICAMSSDGEVFTVAVSHSELMQSPSASTTNPSKIRGALSQPSWIWSLRKSHMAARDVAVDADGSIVLTTEAGTVWKRMKRVKIKDASAAGSGSYKPKDYKFSRVPGLTGIAAVRASAYGAYAAVRVDCTATRKLIAVPAQTLRQDISPLLPFDDMRLPDKAKFGKHQDRSHNSENLKQMLLNSDDLERDVSYLTRTVRNSTDSEHDMLVCSSESAVRIPVHRFILASRSRALIEGLSLIGKTESFSIPEILTLQATEDNKVCLRLQGFDLLTVVNLVLYSYTDTVIDLWHYTRQSPKLAFRYRQIRTELMRLAARLQMPALEAAVRQMVRPTLTLKSDMEHAIQDPRFFENGDVLIQLADREVRLHAALICRRCPFFDGLFHGRASGRWLAERRNSDVVRVDLKHITSSIFELVKRHIYSDAEDEIFDDVVTEDLDGLLDIAMEVMSVANELMLDRLSRVCQRFIGRYVTVRNVCQLLNAIAPSSVTDFKDAALEYLCHNLELMLATGLLEELDENLLLDLDNVVRTNQLACLPFVRSGEAEARLLEKYPDLSDQMERERKTRIDSAMVRAKYSESDSKPSTSFRANSEGDMAAAASLPKSRRRPSKDILERLESPLLKANRSAADLMFEMDEDEPSSAFYLGSSQVRDPSKDIRHHGNGPNESRSPRLSPSQGKGEGPTSMEVAASTDISSPPRIHDEASPEAGVKDTHNLETAFNGAPISPLTQETGTTSSSASVPDHQVTSSPWRIVPAQPVKLGMKDIMAQDSATKPSTLSLQLAATTKKVEPSTASSRIKLSQKERKRLQQAQQSNTMEQSPREDRSEPNTKPSSPWQMKTSTKPSPQRASSASASSPSPAPTTSNTRSSSASHLTLRQTVANKGPAAKQSEKTNPETKATQGCSVSNPQIPSTPPPSAQTSSANAAKPASSSPTTPKIQSIRHILPSRPSETHYALSIADIVSQQEAEKNFVKDAVAKRSLQDIQMEQEFQEWWDQESKKVMEEEAAAARAAENAAKGGKPRRPRGRRGGGRGGGASDRAEQSNKGKGRLDP